MRVDISDFFWLSKCQWTRPAYLDKQAIRAVGIGGRGQSNRAGTAKMRFKTILKHLQAAQKEKPVTSTG